MTSEYEMYIPGVSGQQWSRKEHPIRLDSSGILTRLAKWLTAEVSVVDPLGCCHIRSCFCFEA